jgi:hypothetical protein
VGAGAARSQRCWATSRPWRSRRKRSPQALCRRPPPTQLRPTPLPPPRAPLTLLAGYALHTSTDNLLIACAIPLPTERVSTVFVLCIQRASCVRHCSQRCSSAHAWQPEVRVGTRAAGTSETCQTRIGSGGRTGCSPNSCPPTTRRKLCCAPMNLRCAARPLGTLQSAALAAFHCL